MTLSTALTASRKPLFYNKIERKSALKASRYGFQGMEKDDEVEGAGNSYITDYRAYDPRLGRWKSLDPEMKRYPYMSPYCAFANNPIIVVDVNGDTIKIVGSVAFQKQTLTALQKLTNDELALKSDGTVVIKKMGGQNPSKNLKEGTGLIRELNKKGQPDAKMNEIQETTGGNGTSFDGVKSDILPGAKANTGENTTVEWNPNKTTGGVDVNGSTTRPTEIGLGHELEHARHVNNGVRDPGSSGVLDPDGSGTTLSKEELNTRHSENKLRTEQGAPLRKVK